MIAHEDDVDGGIYPGVYCEKCEGEEWPCTECREKADGRQGDNWTITYTGVRMYPLEPRLEDVNIADIAHALSNICRWNGHTREFFSVAQHSVLVSQYAQQLTGGGGLHIALWGLLHDAPEAYMCDLPRPIKRARGLEGYSEAESRLMGVIADRYRMDRLMPDAVKQADDAVLMAEARDFLPTFDLAMMPKAEPWPTERIEALPPRSARDLFIRRFVELTSEEKW